MLTIARVVPIPDSRFPSHDDREPSSISIASRFSPSPPAPASERFDRSRIEPALNTITSEGMLGHIRTLASDAYEGRAPGTPGEDSTVAYLTAQFKSLGLAPGNPDGSYVQNVRADRVHQRVDRLGPHGENAGPDAGERRTSSRSRGTTPPSPGQQLRDRLRRLRRRSARIRMGRLQGRRRARKDGAHHGWRSADPGSPPIPRPRLRRCSAARR